MLTCNIGAAPEVEILHPWAGLEDQPQAEVIQPLAVGEVQVGETEAAWQPLSELAPGTGLQTRHEAAACNNVIIVWVVGDNAHYYRWYGWNWCHSVSGPGANLQPSATIMEVFRETRQQTS